MAKSKQLDWKSASDYEYIIKLSKKRLAWEYLRRSEDYQKAYHRGHSGNKNTRDAIKEKFGIKDLLDPHVTPLPKAIAKKFFVFSNLVAHYPIKKDGEKSVFVSPVPNAQVAIVFDLSISIPRQVERVSKKLKEALRKLIEQGVVTTPVQNNKSRTLDIRYLRVIDALAQGASDDAIVGVLSKEATLKKQYSKDNLRKDKDLIESLQKAYRSIAFAGGGKNKKKRVPQLP